MKKNELNTIQSVSESDRFEKIHEVKFSIDSSKYKTSQRDSYLDDSAFDPKKGFATRFYGANEHFFDKIDMDRDLFESFATDLKSKLKNNKKQILAFKDELNNMPIIDGEYFKRFESMCLIDSDCQTDMHYHNICVKNRNIINNEKIISFLEREKNQLEKRYLGNRRPDYEQSSHMNYTLFIEYQSNEFNSPYLEINKNNIVKFNAHSDIMKSNRLSLPQIQPVHYNFDDIFQSYVQNDVTLMANHTIQKVNDERDVIIIIYGSKRTGKRKLKNLLITSIFKYFEKVLIEGNIETFNFNFSALLKDLDTRFSDLCLKSDSYQEQLLNLLNSQLKHIDKKFLKEKIKGSNTKCAFFELSRIAEESDSFGSEFQKSVCVKVSGLYVITVNKLTKQNNKSKKHFIKSVLRDTLSENKDSLIEEPLQRLLKNFESAYTKVICTLNPYAIASKQSYNLIQTLPICNKYYD